MIKDKPASEWEKRVSTIWCEILSITIPLTASMTTNIFSLGGNSLQLMKIIAAYRSYFNCMTHFPPITAFVENATIQGHAHLLEQTFGHGTTTAEKQTLQALHATEGKSVCILS